MAIPDNPRDHMTDQQMRDSTKEVLFEHRVSLRRVRNVLDQADKTLIDEIHRLDGILKGKL